MEHWSGLSLQVEFQATDTPWWMHFWTRDFPQYGIAELAAWRLLHHSRHCMVDIGANVGQISLLLAGDVKRWGSPGRMVAVEADPVAAKLLRRHVENNGASNIVILEGAVVGHASSKQVTMCSDGNAPVSFVPELVWAEPEGQPASQPLTEDRFIALQREAGIARATALVPEMPGGPWNRRCAIPVEVHGLTVEEVILAAEDGASEEGQLDFVKIDVEGAEASILPVIVPLLAERKASLFVSIHLRLLGVAVVRHMLELLAKSFPAVIIVSDMDIIEVAPGAELRRSFAIPDVEYFDVVATFHLDRAELARRFHSTMLQPSASGAQQRH